MRFNHIHFDNYFLAKDINTVFVGHIAKQKAKVLFTGDDIDSITHEGDARARLGGLPDDNQFAFAAVELDVEFICKYSACV